MWRLYPVGDTTTHWQTGLWSTQTKVEGIVTRAAWHWGRDSTVVNDLRGEPGRTPLYVGLPSAWGSVDGDLFLSKFCRRAPVWGDSCRHKLFRWLWRRSISLHRDPVGEHGGAALPGTLRERRIFSGCDIEGSVAGCLSP